MVLKRFSIIILTFSLAVLSLHGQFIPHSIRNSGIYTFTDELAAAGIIEVNSAIKPYDRGTIARWLESADGQREMLTPRQREELDFYLKDFGKELYDGGEWKRRRDLLYYRDDSFTITANPVFGGEVITNKNGTATYWRNGAEAWASVGRWGFYASLRDNHEKPLMGDPQYLTQRDGGHVKGGTDWSEMRAGVSYQWSWGSVMLANDLLQWGNAYNGSNIFDGSNPAFFTLNLRISPVEWFELNYFHGSLKSMVVDSASSYWTSNSYGTNYREVYHRKYIASNMLTFKPLSKLHLSAGNSIIYSDYGVNEVFLLPLLFFKSVDHSMNSGIDNMNSMMFFDISSRQIRNVHLYATWFIDELSVYRFFDDKAHNFFSYKAGAALYNMPLRDIYLNVEFTFSYPLAFQHYVPTLTFESNGYNLGHYLKDNAREWFLSAGYRPLRTMDISLWYSDAVRGPDYTSLGTPRVGNPVLSSVEWHNRALGLNIQYQIINDLYITTSAVRRRVTGVPDYMPEMLYGTTTTISAGITAGF